MKETTRPNTFYLTLNPESMKVLNSMVLKYRTTHEAIALMILENGLKQLSSEKPKRIKR